MNVKSGKECLPVQLFQDEINPGHGIDISVRPFVNVTIVLDKVKTSILFMDKEHWTAPWGLTVLDVPQFLIFMHKAVSLCKFCLSEGIHVMIQCIWCSWLEPDHHVVRLGWWESSHGFFQKYCHMLQVPLR